MAEDPEADCIGAGSVEAEAVDNLASADAEAGRRPLTKGPGRTAARPGAEADAGSSVLDGFRELL